MPLRVVFNATPLLSPLTGIGNYIVHLGQELAATGEIDAWSFYRFHWRHEAPKPPPKGPGNGGGMNALKDRAERLVPMKRELRQALQQAVFGFGVRHHGIELYHEPNYVPIRRDIPFVITLHDLSWLRYPDTHPRDRIRWLERGLPRAVDEARMVLVDSEFVRGEVLATFPIAAERVRTVHLGVADRYRLHAAGETAPVLRALGLEHGTYVLTVGTIEPRKNLGHLLAAYAALPASLRGRHPLVVAGAKGWRAGALEKDLHALTERGQVRFLGHVEAENLPALYAGAALFAYPSLYEGFGLPPLEAMASGVPVLASDRASLPEIIGDAGVLIDPENVSTTTARIEALLEDRTARAEFARRGLVQSARFSWAACAAATLAAYRAAI